MKNILVTQSSMPSYEEYCEEIKSIWDTKWLTNNGEKHEELQHKLEEYLGAKHVTLFCNGHSALYSAIKTLGLTGEIITTPYTFASTTHAIVQNGCVPVFCDIKEDDFTIDVDKIESLITENTSAILAVHVYGNPCDVDKIDKIAKKHNLKVIYDAAHAFGVKYKGKPIASYGDVSMFSFHATKVFNTIEGGCLAFNDDSLVKKLDQLKNFGIVDAEHVNFPGFNYKMNEFQAAMGICNLRHLDDEIKKRKKNVGLYLKLLKDVNGINLNAYKRNIVYNYAYFPILVNDDFKYSRDNVYLLLAQEGIFSRKYFYPLTSDFECYKEFNNGNLNIASKVSDSVLTLPLYADLKEEEIKKICTVLKKIQ